MAKARLWCLLADVEKIGFNPKTGENVKTQRRELWVNTELPVKELYANWLAQSFLN